MDAYMFQAGLYCEDCIVVEMVEGGAIPRGWMRMDAESAIRKRMTQERWADERDYDSDELAKGPYADGGGEADSPQYCGRCQEPLGNPVIGIRQCMLCGGKAQQHGPWEIEDGLCSSCTKDKEGKV